MLVSFFRGEKNDYGRGYGRICSEKKTGVCLAFGCHGESVGWSTHSLGECLNGVEAQLRCSATFSAKHSGR